MFVELDNKDTRQVKFYPSGNNFTQALLVTNITSGFRFFLPSVVFRNMLTLQLTDSLTLVVLAL